jgi:hypothetical protein
VFFPLMARAMSASVMEPEAVSSHSFCTQINRRSVKQSKFFQAELKPVVVLQSIPQSVKGKF